MLIYIYIHFLVSLINNYNDVQRTTPSSFGSRAGRFGRFAQLTTQPPFGSGSTEFVIFSVPGIRKIRRICIDARYEISSAGLRYWPLFVPIMAADRRLPAPYYFIKPVDT